MRSGINRGLSRSVLHRVNLTAFGRVRVTRELEVGYLDSRAN
jgi:hypothetical protein